MLTRRIRTLAASLAAAALAAVPAAAQTVRIDFSEFRSDLTTEYQATPGGEVTSKGFDFYAAFGTGARNALGTWGTNDTPDQTANLPTNLGSSTALWGTQFGERMDMETSDGRLFDLFSMDVAHQYNRNYLISGDLSPITLFFYGFNAAGVNSIAASFNIPAPPIVGGQQAPVLSTLVFGGAWRQLSGVAWFQGSGALGGTQGSAVSHQFTNVVAAVVPEPSTYLLVATGMGGLLLVARRRRDARV